jgi:hypothetical protein
METATASPRTVGLLAVPAISARTPIRPHSTRAPTDPRCNRGSVRVGFVEGPQRRLACLEHVFAHEALGAIAVVGSDRCRDRWLPEASCTMPSKRRARCRGR